MSGRSLRLTWNACLTPRAVFGVNGVSVSSVLFNHGDRYPTVYPGHMTHSDLTLFLKRSRSALRDEASLIFVKENVCADGAGGKAIEILDEEDSSLTR